jgi:hypothetical protein
MHVSPQSHMLLPVFCTLMKTWNTFTSTFNIHIDTGCPLYCRVTGSAVLAHQAWLELSSSPILPARLLLALCGVREFKARYHLAAHPAGRGSSNSVRHRC